MTHIQIGAFSSCEKLKSITIGTGVKRIDEYAFRGCKELTSISFDGTVAEWQAITLEFNWDSDSGAYTITCTDGTIAKDGTVTYN